MEQPPNQPGRPARRQDPARLATEPTWSQTWPTSPRPRPRHRTWSRQFWTAITGLSWQRTAARTVRSGPLLG